jgi:nucleoid-associated protein YgaU
MWAIAARHIGPQASPLQVAREWPRWYAANRTVIGSNPNLIRAGQVLTVPPSGAPS